MSKPTNIHLPPPRMQIEFAHALNTMRAKFLQNALLETVGNMDIAIIDKQLASFVNSSDLSTLARIGLRGELLFAVPHVLETNPYLLGYYRMLMGYSQKEFYGIDKAFGISRFKSMEIKGIINPSAKFELPFLCAAFCASASALLRGIDAIDINRNLLDSLTLLTLGPQLRGGANNQLGINGIAHVFKVIREIVSHAASDITGNAIKVTSATGRPFVIKFASDPDIIIQEEMEHQHYRNVVAIEIKSGSDKSNIHNRIGEAEKSHQKAKLQGYTECWTIVNVSRFDYNKARSESPTTNRFYLLSDLMQKSGIEYEDFRRRLLSLTAIPVAPTI